MFTSRAEYRLLLREDNADLRLSDIGRRIGLVNDRAYDRLIEKKRSLVSMMEYLENCHVTPSPEIDIKLQAFGSSCLKQLTSLRQLLCRPELSMAQLRELSHGIPSVAADVDAQIEIQVKYQGYVNRQIEMVGRFQKMEQIHLPDDIDYRQISGLSREVSEKLTRIKPRSLGQASRISGITPAALTLLSFYVKKKHKSAEL